MAENATSVIVIPARRQSTRLPGKMLLSATGKPLIMHTVDAASRSKKASSIIVATDDQEIFDVVSGFGKNVEMTSVEHASGTDRVAEVADRHPYEIVVNLQGDEPEISGQAIDSLIAILEQNPEAAVATLATPIRSKQLLEDPACVKVVMDQSGRAMYFSRSPIPHARTWDDGLLQENPAPFLQHVGLYAYRRDFLLKFSELPFSFTEKLESLEQLRVLSAGYAIFVGLIDEPVIGIDTREDYELFVRKYDRG